MDEIRRLAHGAKDKSVPGARLLMHSKLDADTVIALLDAYALRHRAETATGGLTAIRHALGLSRSIALSGERWSETAEAVFAEGLAALNALDSGRVIRAEELDESEETNAG